MGRFKELLYVDKLCDKWDQLVVSVIPYIVENVGGRKHW